MILKLLTLEQDRLAHCATGTALGGPGIETIISFTPIAIITIHLMVMMLRTGCHVMREF